MLIVEPLRVERTYLQKLNAEPARVFPLLCPVLETQWVKGWEPNVVLSYSGVAEQDCVFTTGDEDNEAVWVITRHDPENFLVEIVKVTPGFTVGKIAISLVENGEGGTEATVTYAYTALGDEGAKFVMDYTEEYYAEFMKHWENSLNEYLEQ